MANELSVVIGGNALPILVAAGNRAPAVLKEVVKQISLQVIEQAKRNVKSTLNTTGRATGNLGRGITMLPTTPSLEKEVGPQTVYGAIHEFGGTIRPKTARALFFMDYRTAPGHLVMVQSVTMPKRPYLAPAAAKVQPMVPGIVEAELRKILGG
jgi:phage gpG-like protein